jgi:uncharacterized protein YraI
MLRQTLITSAVAGALLAPGIAAAATTAITTADLNIRTGPSASYQRFDTIPARNPVTVYGCLNGYNWCDVGWAGERGWVSGSYLAYRSGSGRSGTISSVGVSIGLPVVGFEPYAYHGRYYRDRSWYRDSYIDRPGRPDVRDRRERRELRDQRRDVRDAREDRRDARRDLREARRDGENLRPFRRELREERRDLRQERRELRRERRD